MNIFNTPQIHNSEFKDCKIRYLIAENKLLSAQSEAISKVIKLYKQIIDISTKTQKDDQKQEKITNLFKQSSRIITQCLRQCQTITNSQNLFSESDELFITPEFFTQLVLSYEKTIAELKSQIHHRQVILQDLETCQNHPLKRKLGQIQSASVIRAIQSYDIYPKLAQRCRNQIIELKMRKKKIQQNCMNKFYGKQIASKQQQDTYQKTIKINCGHKAVSFNQKSPQNMSTFQKVILIYKKKKLFNQILQKKVIQLKKKIQQKEVCNQFLKQRVESEQWQNFNKCKIPKNKNFVQQNAVYLSVLNESMKANNLDFSVDLSKILPVNISNEIEDKENQEPNVCMQKILEQY